MWRKPNPVPTYRLHRQSGQAVCTVRTPDGRRRDVLLGRHGSPASKAEYARVVAELRVSPVVAGVGPPPVGVPSTSCCSPSSTTPTATTAGPTAP